MNRIEIVRAYVDDVLLHMTDAEARRCGYLHLYGVAQACAMIAMKRGMNAELPVVAGMLHDIAAYATLDSTEHAARGAVMAREILESLGCFAAGEVEQVCAAIHHHSDKAGAHAPLDEVLKDADVLQHCLYDPLVTASKKESVRYAALKKEFAIA